MILTPEYPSNDRTSGSKLPRTAAAKPQNGTAAVSFDRPTVRYVFEFRLSCVRPYIFVNMITYCNYVNNCKILTLIGNLTPTDRKPDSHRPQTPTPTDWPVGVGPHETMKGAKMITV